ncbi:hypothetical protein HOY82DRAFT_646882 [Tuber indicum]|nr:hypothetical protein HOY82DRAFT_646882 [Tuber indicum]
MEISVLKEIDSQFLPGLRDYIVFKSIDTDVGAKLVPIILNRHEKPQYRRLRVHFNAGYGTLMVIKPTALYETAVDWLMFEVVAWCAGGFLTIKYRDEFEVTRPTVKNFLGRFAGSVKIPDLAFTPFVNGRTRAYPSVVLECSSERSGMHGSDIQLWQEGTAGAVKVVLCVQLVEPEIGKQMTATLMICRFHLDDSIERALWNVFPVPESLVQDPFITIDELFAGHSPPELDPKTHLPLNMQDLRRRVGRKIKEKGYIPA